MCRLSNILLSLRSRVTIFITGRKFRRLFNFYIVTCSYSSRPFLCALVTKYETKVMGLTPNGSEVNHICESLNYQCLSHDLGNEANVIVDDET